MKHTCTNCDSTSFRVIETHPCEDHTLRQLKCRKCGENLFTHEYIMDKDEYCWQMISGKYRLRLRQR